jgi:iron transport multicopper oxidase
LVIYDPKDPHGRLYDVDNGEIGFKLQMGFVNSFLAEFTIITLGDWYHYVSAEAPLAPSVDSYLFDFLR